jgi:hypothetical protein
MGRWSFTVLYEHLTRTWHLQSVLSASASELSIISQCAHDRSRHPKTRFAPSHFKPLTSTSQVSYTHLLTLLHAPQHLLLNHHVVYPIFRFMFQTTIYTPTHNLVAKAKGPGQWAGSRVALLHHVDRLYFSPGTVPRPSLAYQEVLSQRIERRRCLESIGGAVSMTAEQTQKHPNQRSTRSTPRC